MMSFNINSLVQMTPHWGPPKKNLFGVEQGKHRAAATWS